MTIRVLQEETALKPSWQFACKCPTSMMHMTGAKFSRGQSQALVALLLVVILGLCMVHFQADASEMGTQDPCLGLAVGLILVFALITFWQCSWIMTDPISVRYGTSLYPAFPPPKRSILL